MNHYIFVLIYYILSSESLRVANSLQSSSVLKTVRKGPLGGHFLESKNAVKTKEDVCARGIAVAIHYSW